MPTRNVVFGIRPEHITETRAYSAGAEFAAPIDVVEPMGMETMVYFSRRRHGDLRPRQPGGGDGARRAHAPHGRHAPHAPDRPARASVSSRRPPSPGSTALRPRCRHSWRSHHLAKSRTRRLERVALRHQAGADAVRSTAGGQDHGLARSIEDPRRPPRRQNPENKACRYGNRRDTHRGCRRRAPSWRDPARRRHRVRPGPRGSR